MRLRFNRSRFDHINESDWFYVLYEHGMQKTYIKTETGIKTAKLINAVNVATGELVSFEPDAQINIPAEVIVDVHSVLPKEK